MNGAKHNTSVVKGGACRKSSHTSSSWNVDEFDTKPGHLRSYYGHGSPKGQDWQKKKGFQKLGLVGVDDFWSFGPPS